MCECIYAYHRYAHVYVHMHICIYVCTFAHMYVHMRVCTSYRRHEAGVMTTCAATLCTTITACRTRILTLEYDPMYAKMIKSSACIIIFLFETAAREHILVTM